MSKQRRIAWLVLILLAASFLRFHDLPQIPPGMTHDEADHGLDAWRVVQGERPIYFTVGYGREPLFDYSTALLMSFLGPSYLTGRLTAAFFSLLLIAATYAWMRQALGPRPALLTAAALAVSFWPLMTGRQALRSVTLPAVFSLAVAFFWRLESRDWRSKIGDHLAVESPIPNLRSPITNLLLSALLLGLAFYTYIPARAMWLVFPAVLLYLWWVRRPVPWRAVAVMLIVAALVGLPLFIYLYNHPQAEVRIGQLAGPLRAALNGEWRPLLANVVGGAGIITVTGDSQWRYNIAGRPLLGPLMGALFYLGLALALARTARCALRRRVTWGVQLETGCRQAPGLFFALVWLLLGLAPVLITGPELSTTQAIAAQPVLYLFPALALVRLADWLRQWKAAGALPGWLGPGAAVLLFALLGANTARAYFDEWANQPQVTVQYEADLVVAIEFLNARGQGASAISTNAPNPFHDPAVARLFLTNDEVTLHWFDGRHSLLLPAAGEITLIETGAAPLNPALRPHLQALQPQQLSTSDDLEAYTLSHNLSTFLSTYPQIFPKMNTLSTELSTDIRLGDAARFLGYEVVDGPPRPGETVQLLTMWQVLQPPSGPLVLFSHVLGPDGTPLAQADRLDAPSAYWQTGDVFIQLHEVALPEEMAPGSYPLAVGLYPADNWRQRLPVRVDGQVQGDVLRLPPLDVQP